MVIVILILNLDFRFSKKISFYYFHSFLFFVFIHFFFFLDSLKLFSTEKQPINNTNKSETILPESLQKQTANIEQQKQQTKPLSTTAKSTLSNSSSSTKEKEPDKLSDFKIIASLGKYLWPKEWGLRGRVVVSFGLLAVAKLLTIQVPMLFKQAIDLLATTPVDPTLALVPITLLLGYGAARAGSSLFNELRSAIFAAVVQKSVRVCVYFQQFLKLKRIFLVFVFSIECCKKYFCSFT